MRTRGEKRWFRPAAQAELEAPGVDLESPFDLMVVTTAGSRQRLQYFEDLKVAA